MRMRWVSPLWAVFMAAVAAGAAGERKEDKLVFAWTHWHIGFHTNPSSASDAFDSFAKYLTPRLGRRVESRVVEDLDSFRKLLRTGEIDGGILSLEEYLWWQLFLKLDKSLNRLFS